MLKDNRRHILERNLKALNKFTAQHFHGFPSGNLEEMFFVGCLVNLEECFARLRAEPYREREIKSVMGQVIEGITAISKRIEPRLAGNSREKFSDLVSDLNFMPSTTQYETRKAFELCPV